MRIKYDTNDEGIEFIKGNQLRQNDWDVQKGAVEFKDEAIILTTLPLDEGVMRLKNSGDFKDIKFSALLTGNEYGQQKIYLRGSAGLASYVLVNFVNNNLVITEKNDGVTKELFKLNLASFDGKKDISVDEDKKQVIEKELETLARYAETTEIAKIQAERLKDKTLENPKKIEDGAQKYEPQLSYHNRGVRQVDIDLKGAQITVNIDGKDAAKDIKLTNVKPGSVYLGAAWGGYGWSQRNLADDVYDGVFDKVLITGNTGVEKEQVLYDERLQGISGFLAIVERAWTHLIDWFIRNL